MYIAIFIWRGSQLRSFRLLTERVASSNPSRPEYIFKGWKTQKKKLYLFFCLRLRGDARNFLLPNYLRRNVRFKASL